MGMTVDIPSELYEQAELRAAREGIPVGEVISQALRVALGEAQPAGRQRIVFPLHHSARRGVLSVGDVRAADEATVQQEDAARARAL
jgi:hypothetical protein